MRLRKFLVSIFVIFVFLVLLDFVECKGGGGGGGRGGSGGRGVFLGYGSGRIVGSGQPVVQAQRSGSNIIPAGGVLAYPNSPYKTQKSRSYFHQGGSGMSAWALLAFILGIIGAITAAWFCYSVGLPLCRDRSRRRSSLSGVNIEGIPLRETPSTATPSP